MGDFERIFGAGADVERVIDGLTRAGSGSYGVVKVCFAEGGKPYFVNCSEYDVEPGDFVIVRLQDHYTKLHTAQVIDTVTFQKRPCKHSVMCRAEDAEAYGEGSDGVHTFDEMHRFLTQAMGYHDYPLSNSQQRIYVQAAIVTEGILSAHHVISAGKTMAGYIGSGYHGDGHYLPISGGVITAHPHINAWYDDDERYKRIARLAEKELCHPI